MALATYADLQTAVATHAWRTGDTVFVAAVPDFIALAHSRIQRQLRVRQMEASATITITSGAGTLPTDYLEFIEVKTDGSPTRVLDNVEPNFGDKMYASGSSGTGQYFSILGAGITTYPAITDDVVMRYYQKIPALSVSNTTNWLLTKNPDVYLYAALTEAAPFMMDDARLVTWGAMYDRAIKEIRDEDVMSKFARASRRPYGYHP